MDNWLMGSATALSQQIRQRTTTSTRVLETLKDHIACVNPQINALVQADFERAMVDAARLDQLAEQGKYLGPLHGVPFTVKDTYSTAGIVTTMGTLGMQHFVPERDATFIQRLKAAGAILIGKTNVPEFGVAVETDNLVYGPTRNPYDLSHTPGGSSGGEAALIASGGSMFGIGSDLAGSLRIPAHYCGVASIRPTIGRVACSNDLKPLGFRDGVDAMLTADGPIARYVQDLYPILRIISGPDGVDPHVYDVPLHDPASVDVTQLRIGYFIDNGVYAPSSSVSTAVEGLVSQLSETLSSPEESHPSFMANALPILQGIMVAARGLDKIETLLNQCRTEQPSNLLLGCLANIRQNHHANTDLTQVLTQWDQYRSELTQYFYPFDALICPVLPFTAVTLQTSLWDSDLYPALSYCVGFSLHPCPVVTVRIGEDEGGLPIGVQVIAKPWREDIALALATYIEQRSGAWEPPPVVREAVAKAVH